MTPNRPISRRTVLRGLGAAITLPLLDAMQPLRALASTSTPSDVPRRMAFFFVPNGVNVAEWTPKRTGYDYDLPSILQPLQRVKDDLLVLSGLTHDKGRANGDGAGDHARSASVFLTAAQPMKTSGGNIRVGTSVDQAAAQQMGQATRFPSLELGCDRSRNSGNCDSGYSCAYSHNISWASPSTPMAKEIDPRLVFERLFGGDDGQPDQQARQERLRRRRSLLDYASDDARRLQAQLGKSDRRKLDEYLTSVRQIERRLEMAGNTTASQDPSRYRKPQGIPSDFAEHVRLMMDMIVLAFQTDLTRVCTCMFAQAGSNRSYKEIDVPDGHHDLSHHGGDAEKLDKIRRINEYHMQQFAYFLERLKSIPEGDGSLLDQCLIVYGSGISDGNRHNHDHLPVLLAGRGGRTIESGRHLVYEEETPMANLFLSLLDRVGLSVDQFGDSTGRLPDLS